MSERPLFEGRLDDLLPPAQAPAPPRWFLEAKGGPDSVARDRSATDLRKIARRQRRLIAIILLHLLAAAGFGFLIVEFGPGSGKDLQDAAFVVMCVGAALAVASVVTVAMMASKLYTPETVVVIVGLLLLLPVAGWTLPLLVDIRPFAGVSRLLAPIVSWIILLMVNGRATHELKRNGIRVGLLGARRSDLRALPEQ